MTISWLWTSPSGETAELCDLVNFFVTRAPRGGKMPPFRVETTSLPDGTGEQLDGARISARTLDVPLRILGEDLADVETLSAQLARYLSPMSGNGSLQVTRANGNVRVLACSYVGGLDGAVLDGIAAIKATLQFKAADPYWYSAAPKTGSQEQQTGGAGWFPIFPLRVSASTVFANVEIVNNGDDVAWPIWTITGPGSTLILRNMTTGEELGVDCDLAAGEQLIIDTRPGKKTIEDGSGINLFNLIVSGKMALWSLERNTNSIDIYLDGATVDSLISWSFQERFLSY